MSEQEVDPYDKGREAMDALFEVLEGEIVQDVTVEYRGGNYPKVHFLISELPIQELDIFADFVTVDGENVCMMDLEKGDELHFERPVLESVSKRELSDGHDIGIMLQSSE